MLSKDFLQNISIKLKHKILSQNLIKGGNINEVYLLQSIKNKWVVKINSNTKFHDFFKTEQLGLNELSKSKNILSAQPVFEGEYNELRYLILEYIEEGEKTNNFWEVFGCQLSQMHTSTKTTFGLNFDNYIGALPQLNNKCDSLFFQEATFGPPNGGLESALEAQEATLEGQEDGRLEKTN